jgi:hypothetical protein
VEKEMNCPLCNNSTLFMSQDAVVTFKIIDGNVVEEWSSEDVDFLDNTQVFCSSCGENDSTSNALKEIWKNL